MDLGLRDPEESISTAVELAASGDGQLLNALDELPTALYVTDADGLVIYYNPACIRFAGRTPVVRSDRWCVTWKLFTDQGDFLPHDQCPMAVALKERRAVRGLTAMAERPDGTRVSFMPYPTPVLKDGRLVGAVNMLVDITNADQAKELWAQASRCRRLAQSVDGDTAETLARLALEFESKAALLGGQPPVAMKAH